MSTTGSEYRLDGIYKQRQEGFYMQRVKLAAGVISALQAKTVAEVATRFGQGTIHLTSRGSMEIHWLKEVDLPQVKRELAKVGLTSRGACGGAVRGITCGTQGSQGFPLLEALAQRLHRHFTGNPRFEHLPKKFKIGLEADATGGRHLIQDLGLVLAKVDEGKGYYDVWIAGGLGREPHPGFLLAEQVAEERIIPLIEAVVTVYATHAPPPKRLKYLAKEFGQAELRRLIEAEPLYNQLLPAVAGLPESLIAGAEGCQRLELPIFSGQLTADQLGEIAAVADRCADGMLMVTADQDLALLLSPGVELGKELELLRQRTTLPFSGDSPTLRVCPGSHECRMGLAATRDLAGQLQQQIGIQGERRSWALSGCPNSCTQPQLAEIGIVTAVLHKDEDGQRTPRFDLYLRDGAGFGTLTAQTLSAEELFSRVGELG